jgi:hypothetical protein
MILKVNGKYVFKDKDGVIQTTELGYFAAEEMPDVALKISQTIVSEMDEEGYAKITYREFCKEFQMGNVKLKKIIDYLTVEGFIKRIA